MKIPSVTWPTSFDEARRLQEALAGQVVAEGKLQSVKLVAGVDMSHKQGSDTLYASAVVLKAHDFSLVEIANASLKTSFPYVPGYLSFREGPVLLEAFAKLKNRVDLIFCDGQGLAHPRFFGLACHLGLILQLPTLGVAKKHYVGSHKPVGMKAGNRQPLAFEGRLVGHVLRTVNRVSPVYVSPGHLISASSATDWALRLSHGYRVPEPTRQAHLHVNSFRKSLEL